MSISTQYAFTAENVYNAPNSAGVYILYYGNSIIYIGRAMGTSQTIRSRLQSHYAGNEGSCTQAATAFSFEVCSIPDRREVELLQWYRGNHGQLPRCNDRLG